MSTVFTPTAQRPEAPSSRTRPVRRWLHTTARFVLVALLTLLAAGQVARSVRAATTRPFGDVVTVDGRRVHIACTGAPLSATAVPPAPAVQPTPTVLIEAGQGGLAVQYRALQDSLAPLARVCVYDRAGLGWSEPARAPRDAANVVTEARSLLAAAGVRGPYVLVGHSVGALYARYFAYRHPDEVAGLVLLDAGHEEQFATVPDTFDGLLRAMPPMYAAMRAVMASGVPALTGWAPSMAGLPERDARVARNLILTHPRIQATSAGELAALPATHAQVRDVRSVGLGDMPVILLSHERCDGCGMLPEGELEGYEAQWRRNQAAVAAESTRGRWQVADGSGHDVHLDRPDLVIDAVRTVLAEAAR